MNPAVVLTVFSILFPTKVWFAPDQPLLVTIKPQGEVMLGLVDFTGKRVDPKQPTTFSAEATIDLREYWAEVSVPGTYVLVAVPKDAPSPRQFAGTPLVIGTRIDRRSDAPGNAIVTKIEALKYAVITTEHGDVTCAFYYDAAPNTVTNFIDLAEGGYFDGLKFHRVVPGFVIQGGDPLGTGEGGPGYTINAEFNNKPHEPGALSMARQGDPLERQGAMPRPEFADSAGSQFFICLDYKRTKQLDGRYTVFGRVIDGINAVDTIGRCEVGGANNDTPKQPQWIKKVTILPVTSAKHPYERIINFAVSPTTQPSGAGPDNPADR